MCVLILGADVFTAARPQASGRAPTHTPWAVPQPRGRAAGSKLAAPLVPTEHTWGRGSGPQQEGLLAGQLLLHPCLMGPSLWPQLRSGPSI